jgi:hypothetical protein
VTQAMFRDMLDMLEPFSSSGRSNSTFPLGRMATATIGISAGSKNSERVFEL